MHPVEGFDRLVDEVLQVAPDRLDAHDRRAVLVQVLHGLPGRRTGQDLVRLGPQLGVESREFGPPPGVRLVEVEFGARPEPGPPRVGFAADRVAAAGRGGGVVGRQPLAQALDRPVGAGGGALEAVAQAVGATPREGAEPAAVRSPARQLRHHGLDLARTRHEVAVAALGQAAPVPLQCLRDALDAGRDHLPVSLSARGHEREGLPHGLRRREHGVELTQPLPGVRHRQLRLEPLAEQPGAGPLQVVKLLAAARGTLRGVEREQDAPLQGLSGGETGRRPVRPPVLPDGGAERGREHRIQGDEVVDVAVGDLPGGLLPAGGGRRPGSAGVGLVGGHGRHPAPRHRHSCPARP